MPLNKKYLILFEQNWSGSQRAIKRMKASISRLEKHFPLTAQAIKSEDEALFEKIDAFRIRFADLQDCIGNKLFRNLLRMEDEEGLNMADTLSRMEKRHILNTADRWRKMREIRNALSHDYPEAESQRAEALNMAWVVAPELIEITEQIEAYVLRLHNIKLGGDH
ncbi:hypothetical protein [Endozoicomonas sp. 8E]|uniref:hypothetical protein n=1 Tax=Endozoicomonas sp. 8E TaxID=3035692 RepID=UPI002938D81D|nr:hypothetical protein [Endozoicomonas sp. 8E]WOG27210.1 hypothetical protein P6910_22090 [Endozoicomonas sp. 8E]